MSRLLAPTNLVTGLAGHNPKATWNDAYNEEYDGLKGLDTFVEIDEEEYEKIVEEHGKKCKVIPTMNIRKPGTGQVTNCDTWKPRTAYMGQS